MRLLFLYGETVCETTECLSCCCVNKTKAYQPTDKAILSNMANGGRNFMESWYKIYLCVQPEKRYSASTAG